MARYKILVCIYDPEHSEDGSDWLSVYVSQHNDVASEEEAVERFITGWRARNQYSPFGRDDARTLSITPDDSRLLDGQTDGTHAGRTGSP